MKWQWQAGITAAAAVFLACFLVRSELRAETKPPAEAPVPVRISIAGPSTVAGQVRATGTLSFKREMSLAFKVQGILASFDVDSGDHVKKGQVLARIDPTEVRSRGSDAQAQLDLAQTQLARAKELFTKGFASQARVDDAQAAVERARAARATTQFDETRAVLVAPADGTILARLAEPHQVIAPGVPVLLMGDTASGLVLKVPLSDGDVTRIRENDTASIAFAGMNPVEASVSRIAAKADGRTGSFDVELKLASTPEGLRSGLVADARITPTISSERSRALAIPALALLEGRGDQAAVFVIDKNGRAQRTSVRTTGFVDAFALIAEGLQSGDRVVTSGAPYLHNGQPVTIVSDVPAS